MFSLFKKHRDEAWDGVVVDKKRSMSNAPGSGTVLYYFLMLRLADGSTKRVRVHRSLFKSVDEGDHVVKAAGERAVKKR